MISSEMDIRPIGYGAMLVEAFVGLLALVAACTLLPSHYFGINADPAKFPIAAETARSLGEIAASVGEQTLVGRTGGAVTLAVGMSSIFSKLPGMKSLMSYWYHFAIMFEALFILTTIDTGTRVARFILQEMLSPFYKPFGKGTWMPGVIITSFAVTFAWFYLLRGGSVSAIWPMFGIANQLLGVVALAVGTTYILHKSSKRVYALTTFLPFLFMVVTVLNAGVQFSLKVLAPGQEDYVKAALTIVMMILCLTVISVCAVKWVGELRCPTCAKVEQEPERDLMRLAEGTDIND